MKIWNKFCFSLFFIYFIIKEFFQINCEMKIFPDHISPGDPVFNKSQIYSKTNEKFIYKLGYYTDSTDTISIYSQKYGIYYEPVSCSGGIYSNLDTTSFFGNIIKDKESTKETNYFEEVELFEKVMTGSNIECPSHLKIVHNKNPLYYI